MTKRQKFALPLLLSLLAFTCALAQEAGDTTLIGVAEETPNLSTLVNAIEAAGLTETLQGSGPYTLFAPTNDAFAKLSSGELSALLSDRDALRRVLSYHIVPGSYTTSDITPEMTTQGFTTLEGQTLPITQAGVGNAAVTTVNLPAANGVLFAIDTVLTPPETVADAPPAANDASSAADDGDDALYSSSAEARERFELLEVDNSGVSGSVLVAEYAGERAVVTVSLSGTPSGSEYPLALYSGSCAALTGEPFVDLEPYSSALGFSTTVVDLPYAELVGGDHTLTVSASASDSSVVACGELGR